MADDLAAVAVVKSSFNDTGAAIRSASEITHPRSLAERAEGPIQLISRWAGILAFCAALGAIAYVIL